MSALSAIRRFARWPSKRPAAAVATPAAPNWGAPQPSVARAPIVKTVGIQAILLGLESWITAIPFTLSWYVCAVYFAIKAGYLMAKADGADKSAVLEKLWKKTQQ